MDILIGTKDKLDGEIAALEVIHNDCQEEITAETAAKAELEEKLAEKVSSEDQLKENEKSNELEQALADFATLQTEKDNLSVQTTQLTAEKDLKAVAIKEQHQEIISVKASITDTQTRINE